jgi:hypothetical protein
MSTGPCQQVHVQVHVQDHVLVRECVLNSYRRVVNSHRIHVSVYASSRHYVIFYVFLHCTLCLFKTFCRLWRFFALERSVLTRVVTLQYILCLFRRFLCIRFVTLYVLPLYVLSFIHGLYTFRRYRYKFWHYTYRTVTESWNHVTKKCLHMQIYSSYVTWVGIENRIL